MLRTISLSRIAVVLLGTCALLGTTLSYGAVKDEILARIKPAGEVCAIGDPCAKDLAMAAANAGPKGPEDVYKGFCVACHGTGVNNAPKFGNAEAWAPHISKGMDTLYDHALNGFNNGAMPPRGTCTSCTDDEVKAAVDYMVDAAKQ